MDDIWSILQYGIHKLKISAVDIIVTNDDKD
jgi:hypothetical protein